MPRAGDRRSSPRGLFETVFGSLKLRCWEQRDGTVLVDPFSISRSFNEGFRAVWAARLFFSQSLHETSAGELLELGVLREVLLRAELPHLARGLPAKVPHRDTATLGTPQLPRVSVADDLSASIIKRFYRLMNAGNNQLQAARFCGLGASTASRLRRGLLNDQLRPAARQAWADTFGQDGRLKGRLTKGASDRVDARNAALIPQLFQLTRARGLSLAGAARELSISTAKASRLAAGRYRSAGPRTRAAWQLWFGQAAQAQQ